LVGRAGALHRMAARSGGLRSCATRSLCGGSPGENLHCLAPALITRDGHGGSVRVSILIRDT
jgi:hypothetical protein